MMEVTDDMLMALADGELDDATATDLSARVARDPGLQRRYAVFADSAAMLRAAFDPGPVPDRLIAAILNAPIAASGDGVSSGAEPAANPGENLGAGGNVVSLPPARRWLPPVAVGLATGLAAGVVTVAIGLGSLSPWKGQEGSAADPAHYAGLATGAETELPDGSKLRMLGSYETEMGLCRMASVDTTDVSERRIICRSGDLWQVALRMEAPAAQGFQPASDTLSGMADQWLDTVGAGLALDPEEEMRALGQGAALP